MPFTPYFRMVNSKIEELQELLRQEPEDAFLRYALALEFEKAGQTSHGIELLLSLIESTPHYLASYYQAGRLLHQDGRTEEAIDVLRKGKEVAKEQKNRHTLSELTMLLSELTDDDE